MSVAGVSGAAPTGASVTMTGELVDMADLVEGEDRWRAIYHVTHWPSHYTSGHGISVEAGVFGRGYEYITGGGTINLGWTVVLWEIDPNLPDAGTMDIRSLGSSPAIDKPFALDFVWDGTGGTSPALPAFFEVYDPSYVVISQSMVQPVPEPGTLACGAAALLSLAALGWRRGRKTATASRASSPVGFGKLGPTLSVFLLLAGTWSGAASALDAGVWHTETVGNFRIEYIFMVSSGDRFSQTHVDYPVTVVVTNLGTDPREFTLSLASSSSSTGLLRSSVEVLGLSQGEQWSWYDLVIRKDRRHRFDPNDLLWQIAFSSPPTLRIINDLDHRGGWDQYNNLLWLRIGPNENVVGGPPPNSYEVLENSNTSYPLPGDQISPDFFGGSYRDYDVSGLGPNYAIMVQTGWWDAYFDPFTFVFLWYEKHGTMAFLCNGAQPADPNTYEFITVTDHTEGRNDIHLKDWVPMYGTWQGMAACN